MPAVQTKEEIKNKIKIHRDQILLYPINTFDYNTHFEIIRELEEELKRM